MALETPSQLIKEIEDKPSSFIRILNVITMTCSVVCYGIILYLLIFHFRLVRLFFTDYTQLQDFISYELKGPIYVIALFFSIILSINPFAQIVPLATVIAFFYGFRKGFIFALLTVIISNFLILYLARNLGGNIVKKIVGEKNWAKVQILANEEGVFPFFIAHLFPVFPDAIVAWVAGTTNLPIPKLVLAGTIARIPGILITVMIGSGIVTNNFYLTGGMFALLVLTSFLLAKYRKNIIKLINRKP